MEKLVIWLSDIQMIWTENADLELITKSGDLVVLVDTKLHPSEILRVFNSKDIKNKFVVIEAVKILVKLHNQNEIEGETR